MNIVFNWSGTLADDQTLTWNVINKTLEYFGKEAVTYDIYKNEFINSSEGFYDKYCPHVSFDEINQYYIKTYIAHCAECKLVKGIPTLIKTLHSINKLYLLSELDLGILDVLSKETGIFAYFAKILGNSKDKTADIKNVGGRGAGSITGAKIIGEFAQGTPWVHLDIAGTSRTTNPTGYQTHGATGIPVRTLIQLVLDKSSNTSK